MTRRSFLFSFLLVPSLTGLTGSVGMLLRRKGAEVNGSEQLVLTGVFRDLEGPKALGRRYLEAYPSESNRVALLRDLLPVDRGGHFIKNPNGLRGYLICRRQRDFQQGQTILLDGWILARTEARLCALIALM